MGDDEATMRQVQQGSREAFERLVRAWEGPMLNYFYRSVGDMDAAEDLRQDLFVRIYRRCDGWRGDGSFRAWVYAIAANLVRTYLRKSRNAVSVEDIEAQAVSSPSGNQSAPPAADELAQRRQSARLVREILSLLSPGDREALILRYFERLRYNELSRVLGIAETTAKSRVYRAVERMRRIVVERGLTSSDLL